MSKSPVVLLGMVCAGMGGAGVGVVRADTGRLQAASGAAPEVSATPLEQSGAHRAPVTGGLVPQERLRQSPLPRPSGRLHLVFPGLHDEVEVNLFKEDGSYDTDAIAQASHLLRCRRTDAEKPIAPRLLMLLSHVEDHFAGRPIEIVSGYRNQRKQTSNHFKGTAADIRIAGVAPRRLRDFATTLDEGNMGIGLYPRSGFVHIDVRPSQSARWVDDSPPGSNADEKRPPRGWKRRKLRAGAPDVVAQARYVC